MATMEELTRKLSKQLNYEPARKILRLVRENNLEVTDEAFAKLLDEQDELKNLRDEFYYPKMKDLPLGKLNLVLTAASE